PVLPRDNGHHPRLLLGGPGTAALSGWGPGPSGAGEVAPDDEGGGRLDGSRRSHMLGDRRAVLISALSTAVFLALIVVVVARAPGTPVVRRSFFAWSQLKRAFPAVAQGFLLNIRIMLIAEVFILVLALLLAIVRSLPGPVL